MKNNTKSTKPQKEILRFIPVPGHMENAHPPDEPVFIGQPIQRVGYTFNSKTVRYDVSPKPFEVEKDSALGRRLMKLAKRDKSLLPFDQETADALGWDFEPMKFSKGEWVSEHE